MSKLIARVEAALQKIRPYLKSDGGDVRVLEIDKNQNAIIELLGNCGSCPISPMTLKASVEETIKKEVPEINSVHAINVTLSEDDSDDKMLYSR